MGKGGNNSAAGGGRASTAEELKKHSAPGDCWLAIEGRVYDVSTWADHPGGRVLFSVAGTDATDSFRAFHSKRGWDVMRRFDIGPLAPSASEKLAPTPFEREYRELYERVRKDPNFHQAK